MQSKTAAVSKSTELILCQQKMGKKSKTKEHKKIHKNSI